MIALKSHEVKLQERVIVLKFQPKKAEKRVCGLCDRSFNTRTKFERFCSECKEQSELYHFHEWLPAC